ncbi:hypothetical protein C5167_001954 [Papaver somniferum]|uniref:Uncharacterized protein n=1 Tax=Papaver somniferum TaxID=3469 RepID=A0A4Y7L0M1_PAPSO|nr:hypothetical protein C5167_001954 [Papaver somniferum]
MDGSEMDSGCWYVEEDAYGGGWCSARLKEMLMSQFELWICTDEEMDLKKSVAGMDVLQLRLVLDVGTSGSNGMGLGFELRYWSSCAAVENGSNASTEFEDENGMEWLN